LLKPAGILLLELPEPAEKRSSRRKIQRGALEHGGERLIGVSRGAARVFAGLEQARQFMAW
jgi:hypothetical protein